MSASTNSSSTTPTTTLRIALDWTPNTLHSGLYLAQHLNLYQNHNLTVHLLPPNPTYPSTPAKLLSNGQADLCICPSESIIAYAESQSHQNTSNANAETGKTKTPLRLQAIYAICQRDASAIAARAEDVTRIAELGDKELVYGSYDAKYEDDIVRAMVEADGCSTPARMRIKGGKEIGKLDLFSAMTATPTSPGSGDTNTKPPVDATWIFLPWEGVDASLSGTKLSTFPPTEHGVPYGYSPVIARDASRSDISAEVLKAFISATKEGYEIARRDPEKVVQVLTGLCVPSRTEEFLRRSMQVLGEYLGGGEAGSVGVSDGQSSLGKMEAQRWEAWIQWLRAKNLLKVDLNTKEGELWTNEFFSASQ